MYKTTQPPKTTLNINKSYKGESIEQKIRRITQNKEPIKDGAPLIYSERKEGVLPQCDVRTDRFEQAINLADAAAKSNTARRDFTIGEKTFDTMTPEQQKAHTTKYPKSKHYKPDTGGESTQTTNTK